MVVERDEKWMPAFDCNPRRSMHPSTSAPAGRPQNGGSVTASASNDSDDDEASSSFNITNRCSPKSVFLLVAKFSEFNITNRCSPKPKATEKQYKVVTWGMSQGTASPVPIAQPI